MLADYKPLYVAIYDSSSLCPSSRNTVSLPSLTIMSLYAEHSAAFIPLALAGKEDLDGREGLGRR